MTITDNQQSTLKERVMVYEEVESEYADVRHNGPSVIWESSQGGCEALKQLLSDADRDQLLSDTPGPSSGRIPSPFQGFSQSSTSSSSTNLSSLFPAGAAASSRPAFTSFSSSSSAKFPRRSRSATAARGNGVSLKASSSSFTAPSGARQDNTAGLSQISSVLARVSRSLNEKAMFEYSISQRKRPRHSQAAASAALSSSQEQSHPTKKPCSSSCDPINDVNADSQKRQQQPLSCPSNLPSQSIDSAERLLPGGGSSHKTGIKDSPEQIRIKALLETIDSAETFTGVLPRSTQLAGSKQQGSKRKMVTQPSILRPPGAQSPPRKLPALGMRRLVNRAPLASVQERSRDGGATLGLSSYSQRAPKANAHSSSTPVPDKRNDPSGPKTQDINYGEEKEVRNGSPGHQRSRRGSKGYRKPSPMLLSPPASSNDDVEMGDNLITGDQWAVGPVDMETLDLGIEEVDDAEEVEENNANMSDGASSANSSYGDMGIDVAELEEACKIYDS